MRIKRFNENKNWYPKNHFDDGINLDNVDINEICPKCGSFSMHIFDHQTISQPEKYEEYGINFDSEIYAESICDECGYKQQEYGVIKWNKKEKEKKWEYLEIYKKGMHPKELKKYNI